MTELVASEVTYAGEYVRLAATIEVQVGPGVYEPLEGGDPDSAKVRIWRMSGDGAPIEAVASTDLTWDAAHSVWAYDWDTNSEDFPAGTYRAKFTWVGPGNKRSFEYLTVKLKAPKDPV